MFLLFGGFLLYLQNQKIGKQWNIPQGAIMYADVMQSEKTLSSRTLGLRGRPDYIIKTKHNEIVPVEVKTGNHDHPKKWHIMQLIAYCHLVSESYNQPVSHGVLVYYDTKKQFRIPYTNQYQTLLTSTIKKMYDHMLTNMVCRTHDDKIRCMHCSFYSKCPEYTDHHG
jgi:CRISPR-associated exonuclease Cas4